MRLTTVICNYNTRAELDRVLASLQRHAAGPDHEIIVVDNASQDGSAALVREKYPAVRLIESGANRWYSGGNNLGLRAAASDYALILNPDTIIPSDAVQRLAAYLDAHPQVGAVTSRLVFADGTVQRTGSRCAALPDLLLTYTLLGWVLPGWRERRRRRMWYDGWNRDTTRAVEVAPGSCLMVRRAILEQIDYFDERLKLFFTDDDLCRRIISTGAEIHFVAETTIIHDEHASLNKVPRLVTRVYFEDLLAYTRKYDGRAAAWALAILAAPLRAGMRLKARLRRG